MDTGAWAHEVLAFENDMEASVPSSFNAEVVEGVLRRLRARAEEKGLEVYPFQVGWYNASVGEPFHFPVHGETLAVLVISAPSMFEKLFLPYIMEDEQCIAGQVDPLDKCIREEMNCVAGLFPDLQVEFVQDSELMPSRRPRVLVQTAGHVAGAAYYYQRTDVSRQPWSEESRIYSVSVHPRYGGWFALRGVLFFHGLLAPHLVQQAPVDCVRSRERRVELLEKFNYSWRDWGYRDVTECEIVDRYSERQKTYFATEPRDRFELIRKWQLDKEQTKGD